MFLSCNNNENTITQANVSVKFTHNWDGTNITSADFNTIKFTNANGEELSIERLRYLVSNIKLTNTSNQEFVLKSHNLVNIGENTGETFTSENLITTGTYRLSFTFGFSDADNRDGEYQDLNSVNFNVPGMLGGGYHFMQFDGKYLDTNQNPANFNYHTIRAVNRNDPNNIIHQDTSFVVDLGEVTINNTAEIEIKATISEWFKNPNTWNLNILNTVLMPNFDAQILMHQNGKSVFTLGEINQ